MFSGLRRSEELLGWASGIRDRQTAAVQGAGNERTMGRPIGCAALCLQFIGKLGTECQADMMHPPCNRLISTDLLPTNCTIYSFDAATRFGHKPQPSSGSCSLSVQMAAE